MTVDSTVARRSQKTPLARLLPYQTGSRRPANLLERLLGLVETADVLKEWNRLGGSTSSTSRGELAGPGEEAIGRLLREEAKLQPLSAAKLPGVPRLARTAQCEVDSGRLQFGVVAR